MKHNTIILINLLLIFTMAISGIFFGIISGSKSILTDGIVSSVILMSSGLGLYIQKKLADNNDKYLYPYGKWRFQNIYNLLRMITLLMIIMYSFLEAIFTIYHYIFQHVVPTQIAFHNVLPYFFIKTTTVILSLTWLSKNKNSINEEEYKIEFTSVLVDGLLTVAIIIGMTIFANIELIKEISDSLTLLIVAIILAISIFKELKHLISMMIGKRLYIDKEEHINNLLNEKYNMFTFNDIHIEKYGIVTLVFINCSFTGSIDIDDLKILQEELRIFLKNNGLTKPRLQFYFSTN